jgi:hypothetical protein
MPIDSAHIRHQNFLNLYQRFRDANPELPERGMLKMFAEHMGLSDRYLSHIKCNRKNIGNNVARTIEEALGLQYGWMDREHTKHSNLVADVNDAEKMFLETAKTLYRSDPEGTHRALMELLQKRLQPLAS